MPALQLQVGDEVPGFAGWAQWTQEAMLQQGQVRWAPEGLAPHESASSQRVVEQHMPNNMRSVAQREPAAEDAEFIAEIKPRSAEDRNPAPAEALYKADSVVVVPAEPNTATASADFNGMAGIVPAAEGETIFQSMGVSAPPTSQFGQVKESAVPNEDKGAHDCHLCDRRGFKDYAGLRIHMSRAHRPQKEG